MYDAAGTEPPCDECYVELDKANIEVYEMYQLVGNQVRVTSMGEIIGLDYAAVINTIKLYIIDSDIKEIFEGILMCCRIEQKLSRTEE